MSDKSRGREIGQSLPNDVATGCRSKVPRLWDDLCDLQLASVTDHLTA
jgi:hypothetical protein